MNDMSQAFPFFVFVFVVVEGIAIVALARVVGLMQMRLGPEQPALQTPDGLDLYTAAPDLAGLDVRLQRPVSLRVGPERYLLLFVSTACLVCRDLLRDASYISRDHDRRVRVIAVSRGTHDQNRVLLERTRDLLLLSDPNGDMHAAYGVERTPFAFVVEGGRIWAKGIVNSREQAEGLLAGNVVVRSDPNWIPLDDTVPGRTLAMVEPSPGDT